MTHTEAFTLALVLALTAPDDERTQQATALADELAAGLTDIEVARCKREALKQWSNNV